MHGHQYSSTVSHDPDTCRFSAAVPACAAGDARCGWVHRSHPEEHGRGRHKDRAQRPADGGHDAAAGAERGIALNGLAMYYLHTETHNTLLLFQFLTPILALILASRLRFFNFDSIEYR